MQQGQQGIGSKVLALGTLPSAVSAEDKAPIVGASPLRERGRDA